MKNAGAISQPVKTQFGYHIIRLNGRSGGEVPPFVEIEHQASHITVVVTAPETQGKRK